MTVELQNDLYTFSMRLTHSHFLTFDYFVPSETFSSHVFIAGSSSFESQKMERPSLNVLSPSSPGMLQDAPHLMPGQLSVSVCPLSVLGALCWKEDPTSSVCVSPHSGETVVRQSGPSADRQRSAGCRASSAA